MLVLFIVYFELILLLRFKLAACSRAKHDEHSAALGSPPNPPPLQRSAAPRARLGLGLRPRAATPARPNGPRCPPQPPPSPPQAPRGRQRPQVPARRPTCSRPAEQKAALPPRGERRGNRRHAGSAARAQPPPPARPDAARRDASPTRDPAGRLTAPRGPGAHRGAGDGKGTGCGRAGRARYRRGRSAGAAGPCSPCPWRCPPSSRPACAGGAAKDAALRADAH